MQFKMPRHDELSLERRQDIVSIIQTIRQPNTQFKSNAKRAIRNKAGINWVEINVQAIYLRKMIKLTF